MVLLVGGVTSQQQQDAATTIRGNNKQQQQQQYGNQLVLHLGGRTEQELAQEQAALEAAASRVAPRLEDLTMEWHKSGKLHATVWDTINNAQVNIPIPRYFFADVAPDRIVQELDYHYFVKMGQGWSERVVLELFFYAVTLGLDYNPITLKQAVLNLGLEMNPNYEKLVNQKTSEYFGGLDELGNWLKDDVSICMWEGITCGVTAASSAIKGTNNANVNNSPKQQGIQVVDGNTNPTTVLQGARIQISNVDPATGTRTTTTTTQDGTTTTTTTTSSGETTMTTTTSAAASSASTNSLNVNINTSPLNRVTKIDLVEYRLAGTLPTELYQLTYLHRLNLNDNQLHGTVPTTFGLFSTLSFMDLGVNSLEGTIPTELAWLNMTLEELWFEKNQLQSSEFPAHLMELTRLEFLDISGNQIKGTIPTELGRLTMLESLFFEENGLSGTFLTEIGLLRNLKVLDFGFNRLKGTLPTELGKCSALVDLNVVSQLHLEGLLPTEIWRLSRLETMLLSQNYLRGPLPSSLEETYITSEPDEQTEEVTLWGWSKLWRLNTLAMDRNLLNGTIPLDLFTGLGRSLTALDLGFNQLTGTLPTEIGVLTKLERITAPSNKLHGTLPKEFGNLVVELAQINLTSNLFTGTVPPSLCNVKHFDSLLVQEFGCDAILCPPGTFHPDGAASLFGACRPCPDLAEAGQESQSLSRVLGRKTCDSATWSVGDVNGDGRVSVREALRVLYLDTAGEWGDEFDVWHKVNVHECSLPGVTCLNGEVVKIDLTGASLCSDDEGNELSEGMCPGLPAELGLISSLEVLVLSDRTRLQGNIPTEIGLLTNLKMLDMSNCPKLQGTLPSELGMATSLRVLNLNGCKLSGSIPHELFALPLLEKINLSTNRFTGTLPTTIGLLESVREMLLSRSYLSGTIPDELGTLSTLENLELYSNDFVGRIPDSMGNCENLKRIDLFNNDLVGTIPPSLGRIGMLQILHLKKNSLTGRIPGSIGSLPYLSWFDATGNYLEGTIPATFASSRTLKDLHLGANRLYDPIPAALCNNFRLNAGRAKVYGCDAILCPLGTHSETGYATDSMECNECPSGETTMYLGSTSCLKLSEKDLLNMFYLVMGGEQWPAEYQEGWNEKGDQPPCYWNGITCDENGEIVGLSFPVSNSAI